MSRRWFAFGGLKLLGLVMGTGTFADDGAKGKTEATILAKDAAIRKKLDMLISLKVKNLPLGEVFSYVKRVTTEPGDTGIPIYVDPVALAKASVSITTPVTYESHDGEPLMDSLETVLLPLGLSFRVEGGLLRIERPAVRDPRYTLLGPNPRNWVIRDRLEKKVDLRFEKTPLEDVLKFVKSATSKGPDDKGIPIYVDPLGLNEAEKTLATPISFVAKGEPLRSSLEQLLKSIGLTYVVKGGLLTVTAASDEPIPPVDVPKPKGARAPD
jgi:hypothetical protein